jgi:iron complex outermembrane recepter protein
MIRKYTRAALGILVAAAAPTVFAAIPANEPASADNNTVEVVGHLSGRSEAGTKTNTPLLETPQTLDVISADEVAAQGAQTVAQSLRYASGVFSEPRGVMTGLDYFYARGFLINQFVDGLRTLSGEYSLPQPDPYFLERIEVLSGPASVLYGQAEPGGVLNLVTKRASPETLREVQIQAGSFGRLQAQFDLNGALTDTLSGRVTGAWKDADTQVDFARERRRAIAPTLTWRPSDATSLTFLANYQEDPDVGYYNWSPSSGTVTDNPAIAGGRLPTSLYTGDPAFDRWSRTVRTAGTEFEHRFNEHLTFRQNLRYSSADSDFRNFYSSFLDEDGHTLHRYAWAVGDNASNWNTDNRLEIRFGTAEVTHLLLTGIDTQHLHYQQQLGYDFANVPPLDLADPVYGVSLDDPPLASDALQRRKQAGLYLQDQISAGGFRILLGGRKDWTRTETAQRIDDEGNYFDGVTDSDRQDAFTGRAGVFYLFKSGVAPYLSYTESFQPQSGTDFAGNAFEPTTGRQVEAGVKYQLAESSAFVTLSIYQLEQQNVVASDEAHPGNVVQTGEIRSRGAELSGAARFGVLQLTASLAHVDQEVTAGDVDFGPQLGNSPATIPENQGSLWADFSVPGNCAGQLGFALGTRYLGASWGDDANSFRVPARTLFDAAVHFDTAAGDGLLANLHLAVNLTNLFDETYVSGCAGFNYCGYGFRRSVLGTLSKRF